MSSSAASTGPQSKWAAFGMPLRGTFAGSRAEFAGLLPVLPRRGVVEAVVEDLPAALDAVAVRGEVLRQRDASFSTGRHGWSLW